MRNREQLRKRKAEAQEKQTSQWQFGYGILAREKETDIYPAYAMCQVLLSISHAIFYRSRNPVNQELLSLLQKKKKKNQVSSGLNILIKVAQVVKW